MTRGVKIPKRELNIIKRLWPTAATMKEICGQIGRNPNVVDRAAKNRLHLEPRHIARAKAVKNLK